MANYYDCAAGAASATETAPEASEIVVYCKLFGDVVQDEVCGLRRQVLAARNGFSCKGCIVNIALTGDGVEGPWRDGRPGCGRTEGEGS